MDWFIISLDLLVIQHRSHEHSSSQIRIDSVDFVLKDIQFLNEIQKLKHKSPEKTAVLKARQFGCGQGIFTLRGG
jgi:hypothetical protein